MFATMKMKKITVWRTRRRSAFVSSSGRMSSIAAPVVPMNDASTAPVPRNAVLTPGVAGRSPRATMPPETTNREARSTMKDT
jgi:hypothetical protein